MILQLKDLKDLRKIRDLKKILLQFLYFGNTVSFEFVLIIY